MQFGAWYKAIYGMPASDRPDEDTINNDVELDTWYENFLRESARKQGGRGDPKYDLLGSNTGPVIPDFNLG